MVEIRALLARHLQLASRLLCAGRTDLAARVAAGAVENEPPSLSDGALPFLIETILAPALDGGAGGRASLAMDPDLLARLRAAADLYVDLAERQARAVGGELCAEKARLGREVAEALAAESADRSGEGGCARPDPPGVARVLYVLPHAGGAAECRRMFVRIERGSAPDPIPSGHPIPGAERAVAAAAAYLDGAGCDPIEGAVECLIEGVLGPIEGESFGLPLAVAAISYRLGFPIPAEVALTGSVGLPGRQDFRGSDAVLLPVNELVAKVRAAARAGVARVIVPSNLYIGAEARDAIARVPDAPAIERAASIRDAVEATMPGHAFPDPPRVAGWRETLRGLRPARRKEGEATARRRILPIASGLYFAWLVVERALIGEYPIDVYYAIDVDHASTGRAPIGIALAATAIAALLVGFLVCRLLSRGATLAARGILPCWRRESILVLAGFLAAAALLSPVLRPAWASPPAGLLHEHRTLQVAKDFIFCAVFVALFFLGPVHRIDLAMLLEAKGRRRWAREVIAGERWTEVAFPLLRVWLLVVVASIAIVGFGVLAWYNIAWSERIDSADPWHTLHILAQIYSLVAGGIAIVGWYAVARARIGRVS
ncbi:MAG: hypothetical protein JXP34_17165 [Planctomycetes bacterium]|nr:hypothetical protein [Planctomycetota bacterium]